MFVRLSKWIHLIFLDLDYFFSDHFLFGAFEDENDVRVLRDWTLHGVPKGKPPLCVVLDIINFLVLDVDRDKLQSSFKSVQQNFDAAQAVMPLLRETALERKYVGILCMTPDAVPLIGPVQGIPNYWIASGLL